MNYQAKGLQFSLLIHAVIFLMIAGMGTGISESQLSPPVTIDLGILTEPEHQPEPEPILPVTRELIGKKLKEPPKTRAKQKKIVHYKKKYPAAQQNKKKYPAEQQKNEDIKKQSEPPVSSAEPSKDTLSRLTGSSFSEDSPVAAPAPAGSGGTSSKGVPGGTGSGNPISGLTGSTEGFSDNLTFGSTTELKYRHKAMPIYPHRARRFGKEGKVILRLSIDEKGNLANVEVMEDSGFGFAEAAIAAVKKSTFVPSTVNGKPVRARALVTVKFVLS